MLFKYFDFENEAAIKLFSIKDTDYSSTWEHYYNSYNYSILKLIEKGLQHNYELNCRARSILFLIRHSLELSLKYNIAQQGKAVPLTHDFSELFDEFDDSLHPPAELKSIIEKIDFDKDGGCYRYYADKVENKPYFTYDNRIELSEIIKQYNLISPSKGFLLGKISNPFDYDNKVIKWDLTFHLGECRNLHHIRTQYDMATEFLIEGILIDNYKAELLYLPLLFLMRHSLELALKANIFEIQKFSSIIKSKNYNHEHSLMTLYNCYTDYLSKIDLTTLSDDIKKQFHLFQEKFKELNDTIHNLDTHSRSFRFPVDKDGKAYVLDIGKIKLIDILKLYYFTDPFITFTNAVLEEAEVLK